MAKRARSHSTFVERLRQVEDYPSESIHYFVPPRVIESRQSIVEKLEIQKVPKRRRQTVDERSTRKNSGTKDEPPLKKIKRVFTAWLKNFTRNPPTNEVSNLLTLQESMKIEESVCYKNSQRNLRPRNNVVFAKPTSRPRKSLKVTAVAPEQKKIKVLGEIQNLPAPEPVFEVPTNKSPLDELLNALQLLRNGVGKVGSTPNITMFERAVEPIENELFYFTAFPQMSTFEFCAPGITFCRLVPNSGIIHFQPNTTRKISNADNGYLVR